MRTFVGILIALLFLVAVLPPAISFFEWIVKRPMRKFWFFVVAGILFAALGIWDLSLGTLRVFPILDIAASPAFAYCARVSLREARRD